MHGFLQQKGVFPVLFLELLFFAKPGILFQESKRISFYLLQFLSLEYLLSKFIKFSCYTRYKVDRVPSSLPPQAACVRTFLLFITTTNQGERTPSKVKSEKLN